MKTFTELPGIPMREIYRWCSELMADALKGKKPAPSLETPQVETAPPAADSRIKSPEERLAEFEKRKEEERTARNNEHVALLDAIKEPLTARIKEKYQWSDERIAQVFPSIDLIRQDQVDRLRRIVLWKSEKEGEPLPKNGQKVGELIYVLEYLPAPEKPKREERPRRGRGGRKEGRRPGKGGRRQEGAGFGPGGDRPRPPSGPGAAKDGRRPPPRRRPQTPRPKVEIKKTLG